MIIEMVELSTQKVWLAKEYCINNSKSIENKFKESLKKNGFGFYAQMYLLSVATNNLSVLDESKVPDKLRKKVEKIITNIELINDDDHKIQISYKINHAELLKNTSRKELDISLESKKYLNAYENRAMFYSSSIIMMLTKFEEAISMFFSMLVKEYPNCYLNDKSILYKDIVNIGESKIIDYIVEKKVEEIMREPFTVWVAYLRKHNLSFEKINNIIEDIVEIYARRNIIVHNSAQVNEIYLKITGSKMNKKGDVLSVNSEYIQKAYEKLTIFLYHVFFESLKFNKDDTEEFCSKLFDIAFKCMVEKDFVIAKIIFEKILNTKSCNESNKLLNKINYWICAKNLGEFETIRDEITNFDVSAYEDIFKMAQVALLDRNKEVTKFLDILKNNNLSASDIEKWPLFIQYRRSSEYRKFKKLNKDYFNVEVIDIKEV